MMWTGDALSQTISNFCCDGDAEMHLSELAYSQVAGSRKATIDLSAITSGEEREATAGCSRKTWQHHSTATARSCFAMADGLYITVSRNLLSDVAHAMRKPWLS